MLKKTVLAVCLLLSTFGYSQFSERITVPKNEVKLNALSLITGIFAVDYERVVKESAAVGLSLYYTNEEDFDNTFNLTPYYRIYFGKKYAAGFFVESFCAFNTGHFENSYYDPCD